VGGAIPRASDIGATAASGPPRATTVPLTAIESQLVSGDREIRLPPSTVRALAGKGVKQAILLVKLCIDATGAVSGTDIVRSCGDADADQSVVAKLRAWRFRPYVVNGQPAPVCAMKMFRYVIE